VVDHALGVAKMSGFIVRRINPPSDDCPLKHFTLLRRQTKGVQSHLEKLWQAISYPFARLRLRLISRTPEQNNQ
jgi:hypothetical protein